MTKNLSKLKQEKIESVSKKSNKKLRPHGAKHPLEVLGTFSALTKVSKTEVKTEFVVVDGEGEALLGRESAVQLGVLQLGVPSSLFSEVCIKKSCVTTKKSLKVKEN